MPETFKVAIVGHTGRGNYGHGLDMSFVGVKRSHIVAVADPDDEGRMATVQKTGAKSDYVDYREMLDKEKPDIAVLASREIGDHCELVISAAEAGCNIYLEKPVAASPAEVDQMLTACDKSNLTFLSSWHDPNMTEEERARHALFEIGARILHVADESIADKLRREMGRKMPW